MENEVCSLSLNQGSQLSPSSSTFRRTLAPTLIKVICLYSFLVILKTACSDVVGGQLCRKVALNQCFPTMFWDAPQHCTFWISPLYDTHFQVLESNEQITWIRCVWLRRYAKCAVLLGGNVVGNHCSKLLFIMV